MEEDIRTRVNLDFERMMEGLKEYKAEQLEFARFRQRIERGWRFKKTEPSNETPHEQIMRKLTL